jgi:hypothetical protein
MRKLALGVVVAFVALGACLRLTDHYDFGMAWEQGPVFYNAVVRTIQTPQSALPLPDPARVPSVSADVLFTADAGTDCFNPNARPDPRQPILASHQRGHGCLQDLLLRKPYHRRSSEVIVWDSGKPRVVRPK